MIRVRQHSSVIVALIKVLAEQGFIHMTVRTRSTVQISLCWGATKIHDKQAIPLTHLTMITQKSVDTGHLIGCSAFCFLVRSCIPLLSCFRQLSAIFSSSSLNCCRNHYHSCFLFLPFSSSYDLWCQVMTLLSSCRCLNKLALLLVQHRDIPLDCHCFQDFCRDHY